ncbi:hypothetical protein Tco_0590039 [Tanacetum coccineum]
MNKKLESKGFEDHLDKRLWNSRTSVVQGKESTIYKSAPKKSGGSCHHTSGNRSVVHDTVNNIRRKSSSYIRAARLMTFTPNLSALRMASSICLLMPSLANGKKY